MGKGGSWGVRQWALLFSRHCFDHCELQFAAPGVFLISAALLFLDSNILLAAAMQAIIIPWLLPSHNKATIVLTWTYKKCYMPQATV